MFDRKAIKEDFGRAAARYDAHAALQREVRGRCLLLAEECWPEGARILDAGCGTGAFAAEAAGRWQVTGLDLSAGMCALAAAQSPVVNADAADMPFADASFDGVFSSLMLQWAGDPLAVLCEMRRVLRPQGICVLSTFAAGTLEELRKAFAGVDHAPHVSEFAEPGGLSLMAAHAGFRMHAIEEDKVIEYYPDMRSVMRMLRAIGAANKHAARRKGLMTPGQFARVEKAYKRGKKGLKVTWSVLYLVMEKA